MQSWNLLSIHLWIKRFTSLKYTYLIIRSTVKNCDNTCIFFICFWKKQTAFLTNVFIHFKAGLSWAKYFQWGHSCGSFTPGLSWNNYETWKIRAAACMTELCLYWLTLHHWKSMYRADIHMTNTFLWSVHLWLNWIEAIFFSVCCMLYHGTQLLHYMLHHSSILWFHQSTSGFLMTDPPTWWQ